MLKYKVGNLITAAQTGEVDVIAHGCNCYNTMGSGIAPQIKKAFPDMYESDQSTLRGHKGKLGKYTVATMNGGLLVGFNLYTQYGFKRRDQGIRDLDYNALYDSLSGMKMSLEANTDQPEGGRRVGFPKIGAGLGGGDWSVISAMISTIFCDEDVTIYVLNKSELPQQGLEVGE